MLKNFLKKKKEKLMLNDKNKYNGSLNDLKTIIDYSFKDQLLNLYFLLKINWLQQFCNSLSIKLSSSFCKTLFNDIHVLLKHYQKAALFSAFHV